MEKKNSLAALIVIITLILIQFFSKSFLHFLIRISGKPWPENLSKTVWYLIWILLIVIAMVILHGWSIKKMIKELGLNRNILKGILFAFISTSPMMVGYYFISKTINFTFLSMLYLALLPGFMEELVFRGFVFGQLYKRARWGVIPAVLINALFFSLGHLWQSHNLGTSIGILLITFAGGAWFAWLFVEWEDNLWVPIGLHFFMNLWWIVFEMGENALGGATANILRALTIAISIVVTVRWSKKRGGLKINRAKLWRNI